MSDDYLLREFVERLARARTKEERGEVIAAELKRVFAEGRANEKSPLLAFLQKLKARQGTIMPDFDDLYRKKADIDHRLAEDAPRP